jgi:hypothetical protein
MRLTKILHLNDAFNQMIFLTLCVNGVSYLNSIKLQCYAIFDTVYKTHQIITNKINL